MELKAKNTDADRTRSTGDTSNGSGKFFATAATLARRGQYTDAAKLLQKALDAGECAEAEALDLQARMYAQQGLHLQAESCWQRAKQIDGDNPAYDEALSRLRQVRLSAGRFPQLVAALSATAVVGGVLWQMAFVNPSLVKGQDAAATSLTAMRKDMAKFQDASQRLEQKLATSISELDVRLAEHFESLPTASEAAKDREAVLTRLDKQMTTLEEASTSLEGRLVRRVEAGQTRLTKRIDAVQDSVRRTATSSPTSVELAKLNQALSSLQEQLAKIGATEKQPKAPPGQ
ncbi:MAG: hypothetical protein HYZ50_20070 [Deltaproteobacteria bacterium]|nr:hypothetical protein [Deltaproteobacteria bacterium]